ncbi:MAG: Zn-dependent hydrolase, partial [Alphaproteobacteria bacterium]
LTDEDRIGRDLFVRWCREAGLEVTVDRMGSIFARRPGRNDALPPIMTGSHLDTQPTGGRFDGVLGVLAALEVVRTLNDHGIETEAPIEIVNWTNEEGARFPPPMIASGVFAGVFSLEEAHAIRDAAGKCMGEELARIGYLGEASVGGRPVGAYFELHIEQGPILERENKPIGICTAGQGARWYEVTVAGEAGHAGATPMDMRQDALVTAALIVQAVQRIGRRRDPYGRGTVGIMRVSPGSPNVIPDEVFFTVDIRHPDAATMAEMDEELRAAAAEAAQSQGTRAEVKEIWYSPPVDFDRGCIAAVREAATALGHAHMDMVSGAGHDAVYMARVAPTALIFAPCEKGLSHNEAENCKPEDLAAACDVLFHAVLERADAG